MDNNLPDGFTLDDSTPVAGLPAGFSLDAPSSVGQSENGAQEGANANNKNNMAKQDSSPSKDSRVDTDPTMATVASLGRGAAAGLKGAVGPLYDLGAAPLNYLGAKIKPFAQQIDEASPWPAKASSSAERMVNDATQGAGSVLPVMLGGAGAAESSVPLISTAGKALSTAPGVSMPLSGATSGASSGAAREAGLGPVGQTLAGIAGGAAPFLGAPAGRFLSDEGTTAQLSADRLAKSAAPYDPMKTIGAISNSYNGAIDKANTFYGFPQQLAEGRSVSAPQVKAHLASVIDDVDNAPWHEAKAQLGTLQRIHDNLPDDGTVPVSDLLDLRKFTNKFFNPARMTDKSATYGKLNSQVDAGLNTAKQEIPNFGNALNIADSYWANNVAQPFLKNKVLQKVWSPEDAHNLRMVDEGQLNDPSDATTQRADNLLGKVKDVSTYNAVRRTLPDDVGQSFDAAMLKNMPTGRAQAAGKLVYNTLTGHFPSALRNAGDVLNPALSASDKATISAVKNQNTYTPLSNDTDLAKAAYENLVKAHMQGEGAPLALEAPPMHGNSPRVPIPQPQKLLPRGDQDTYYQPQGRSLTYQPGGRYETTGPDAVPPSPMKRLTYQPRGDFTGTDNGIVQPIQSRTGTLLGEDQDLPIDAGELEAIRGNPKWPSGQARGGAIHMAKGGAVFPRPKSYPALEKRT